MKPIASVKPEKKLVLAGILEVLIPGTPVGNGSATDEANALLTVVIASATGFPSEFFLGDAPDDCGELLLAVGTGDLVFAGGTGGLEKRGLCTVVDGVDRSFLAGETDATDLDSAAVPPTAPDIRVSPLAGVYAIL